MKIKGDCGEEHSAHVTLGRVFARERRPDADSGGVQFAHGGTLLHRADDAP
jgi:hypothetical protein